MYPCALCADHDILSILAHYDNLHAAGVVHGDVDARHVVGHGDDLQTVRLIDFDHATVRSAENERYWSTMVEKEMAEVRELVGAS